MNTSTGHITIPEENKTLQLMKSAFDAPNNRVIVFTAVRNENNAIIDFEFSLLSRESVDFFDGHNVTGKRLQR